MWFAISLSQLPMCPHPYSSSSSSSSSFPYPYHPTFNPATLSSPAPTSLFFHRGPLTTSSSAFGTILRLHVILAAQPEQFPFPPLIKLTGSPLWGCMSRPEPELGRVLLRGYALSPFQRCAVSCSFEQVRIHVYLAIKYINIHCQGHHNPLPLSRQPFP